MTAARDAELSLALTALRLRVARAAEAAGRDAGDIELLPVTKFFPASDVVALHRLGFQSHIEGESSGTGQLGIDVSPPALVAGRPYFYGVHGVPGHAQSVHPKRVCISLAFSDPYEENWPRPTTKRS